MRRARKRFIFAALLFALSAQAERPRVALVVPVGSADDQRAVVQQMEAELRAAGFAVVVEPDSAPTSRDSLEAVARRLDCFAAISLVQPPGALALDVWVADRVTGKTVLRRIDAPDRSLGSGQVVALRAVELLRASLLELRLPARPTGEVPPEAEVQRFAAPAALAPTPRVAVPAQRRAAGAPPTPPTPGPDAVRSNIHDAPHQFGLAFGPAALVSPGGIPASIAPRLVFSWRMARSFAADVDVAGPARATVIGAEGSADVDQEVALIKGRYELALGKVQPFASIGAGVFRIAARGTAKAPFSDADGVALGAVAAAGLGARWSLASAVSLLLDAQAALVSPRPVLRFAGSRAAESGRPLIMIGFGGEVGW